jgi:hypothetical protein
LFLIINILLCSFLQVCSELDVGLSPSDWSRLRRLLLGVGGLETGGEATERGQLVVLGDFLSELQALRRGQRTDKTTSSRSRNTPEVCTVSVGSLVSNTFSDIFVYT